MSHGEQSDCVLRSCTKPEECGKAGHCLGNGEGSASDKHALLRGRVLDTLYHNGLDGLLRLGNPFEVRQVIIDALSAPSAASSSDNGFRKTEAFRQHPQISTCTLPMVAQLLASHEELERKLLAARSSEGQTFEQWWAGAGFKQYHAVGGETVARAAWMASKSHERREVLGAGDLDVIGSLFGLRFTEGCSNGCVEFYVEDDDNWHFKMQFDRQWLIDLQRVAEKAQSSATHTPVSMRPLAELIEVAADAVYTDADVGRLLRSSVSMLKPIALHHCSICGGDVDLSHATKPTVDWGGRSTAANRRDDGTEK